MVTLNNTEMSDEQFREWWIQAMMHANQGYSPRQVAEASYESVSSVVSEMALQNAKLEQLLQLRENELEQSAENIRKQNELIASLSDRLAACSEILGRIAEKRPNDDLVQSARRHADGQLPKKPASQKFEPKPNQIVKIKDPDYLGHQFTYIADQVCRCGKPTCKANLFGPRFALLRCNTTGLEYIALKDSLEPI